jgi:hypothetical protein
MATWGGEQFNPDNRGQEEQLGSMQEKLKSKQEKREETERLIKEALERKSVSIQKVDGRREEKCGKCGAPNRVKIPVGQIRVEYRCKECGHAQRTM